MAAAGAQANHKMAAAEGRPNHEKPGSKAKTGLAGQADYRTGWTRSSNPTVSGGSREVVDRGWIDETLAHPLPLSTEGLFCILFGGRRRHDDGRRWRYGQGQSISRLLPSQTMSVRGLGMLPLLQRWCCLMPGPLITRPQCCGHSLWHKIWTWQA